MRFVRLYFAAAVALLSVNAWSQDDSAPASKDNSTVALSDTADKPYATIVARNVFGLLPIPPPDTNPPAPPVDPPPKITLNGIMTIFGREQALYKVATKPKPGQQAKEDAYVLGEGERQDDIEVNKIDLPNRTVTFNNHGTVQDLQLTESGSSGSGGGGGPGSGGPANMRSGAMSPADRGALLGSRGRNPGANPSQSGTRPGYYNPANPPSYSGSGAAVFNGGGNSALQPSSEPQTEQTIEDQALAAAKQMAEIEQNRIALQPAVDKGLLPPFPPTMLTPGDATGAGGAPLVTSPLGGDVSPTVRR